MKRREFITLLGGAAVAWPLAARGQKPPLPVIGFLGTSSPDLYEIRLRAFRQGLKEAGYVEGQNVAIEYRWAQDHNERLPALAAELVDRHVDVIVAGGGTPSAMAAKAATVIIPTIFEAAVDPVATGLVASLDKPGGNITGVANLNVEIGQKRLELLHELLPSVTVIAVLANPANPALSGPFERSVQAAANKLGLELHVIHASTERDFDKVFATLVEVRAGALVVGPDVFFNSHIKELAALTIRHAVPTVYQYRPFVEAGGLLSYGSDETETYRLVGVYAGRVLSGGKPADLPVQQSTKVEQIINLKTAKALGLTIPPALFARADELIE
jgi:putative tryptophan/tyrosine transport system substrate-binding protein